MKLFLKDIRFWILLFFAIRLIGITNPPIDGTHNWRQTTVAMPARNFVEIDSRILYPRIDIAGEKTGITWMEFPLLNYSIYLISKLFGYADWYGRIINLIVSSFGLFFFYRLIKKYFDPETAFNATLVLLFSIWFAFSRKIMPDTFASSLMIMSVFFGTNYLDRGNKWKDLILYFLFALAGMLSKLPVAYLGVVYIFLILNKGITAKTKLLFIATSILAIVPVYAYYFYWVPNLEKTYGFSHFFMGKSLGIGISEIFSHLPETLSRFYDDSIKYVGFAFFLFGLCAIYKNKNKQLGWLLAIGFLSFLFIVVFHSGFSFYHHNYYILPFTPFMAMACGYGLKCIQNKKIVALEKEMDKVSQKSDLILINSGDYPTPMYFAHRKGWVSSNENIKNIAFLDGLKEKGLKYVVILKRVFGEDMELSKKKIITNENYDVYAL